MNRKSAGRFGAITYLPTFFQIVPGVTPTLSGVQLLPLMARLLATSIGSGQVITRTGRHRIFPTAGTVVMTAGLFLLSLMGIGSGYWQDALSMLVLGLGMVLQNLVTIVHNAVPQPELGVATSGATFFRSIGGSFGVAIFGAIFSNVLAATLPGTCAAPRSRPASTAVASPRRCWPGCPPPSTTRSPRPTPTPSTRCPSSPSRSAPSPSWRPCSSRDRATKLVHDR